MSLVTLQVIPDRQRQQFDSQLSTAKAPGAGLTSKSIRRPTRGITIKEDTYATMRVVKGDGQTILLTDAAGSQGTRTARQTDVYSNFLLQQVAEERVEKQQILETFGEPYIFLFGERPRMVTFSGVLLNTFDFNWEAEWWENYENYLRGTRCVDSEARVYLAFDQTLVSGYIIASSASKNSNDKNFVNFQFTMFVTGYSSFSNLGDGTAIEDRYISKGDREQLNAIGEIVQTPTLTSTGDVRTPEQIRNPPSLFDGLTAGLQAVQQTWQRAQDIANSAAQTLSNLARGDILRVPVGFAGAFAYDAADVVRSRQSPQAWYGVLRYSEFNQNVDEFVGSSSQYGSSFVSNVLYEDPALTQKRNQDLVNQARISWARAGFSIPSESEAIVSSFIIRNGVGLIPVGSSAVWQTAQAANTTLSVANTSPLEAIRSVSPVPVVG